MDSSAEVLMRPQADKLDPVRKMLQSCIQCGTCSASCPNEFAMDHTPRQLWRMVLMGQARPVFASQTFSLCSACYYCTLRCPRGLPLTEAMSALKQIAIRQQVSGLNRCSRFYRNFLHSVRRHGRVNELELMTRYFAASKHPLLPLSYAGLGMKLMRKKKISLPPSAKRRRPLEAVFKKVEDLEKGR
jgi:heterodisulfide reductase subunit C